MLCPNCGEENTIFISHRNVSRGSLSNGCCGYILLGPIGILCGLCGKNVDEDEYWVCQNCGCKFSEASSIRANEKKIQQQQEAAEYTINKEKSTNILEKHGTQAQLEKEESIAYYEQENDAKTYKVALEKFITESSDPELLQLVKEKKYWDMPAKIMFICFAVAILSMLIGLDSIMSISAIAGLILMFYVLCREDKKIDEKINKLFIEYSDENAKIYADMKASEANHKILRDKLDVVEACNRYEKKNN